MASLTTMENNGPGTAAMLETVGKALREAGARPSAAGSKLARVLAADRGGLQS